MGKILSTVIIYPLTQIIEFSYVFFYRFFKNPGISVIGVSLAVTLLCLPLYIVAERWQQVQRDIEAKLNPRADRIKKAFKGDEQYMMLNTYYKQNHYHPLMALRSSFGLLIQIPFFIAAYSFLSNMPALQGQSFLFIKDMGKPDALFKIGNFSVNILPIAMTLINIVAGAIYTKGFAVKEKVQIYGMALVFLVLLYTSPAGLVLYWTMNNVFSLVKNIFYKLKNPLKVLYGLLCVIVVMMDIYVIFFFNKSSRVVYLRIASVIGFTSLLFIPYLIKGINYLLKTVFSGIVEDKKSRFGIFIFSAVGCALLVGFVLPSLVISTSVQEFSNVGTVGNPSEYIWLTFTRCVGLFVFWPICVYFLFHDRIQTLIALFLCFMLGCATLNAFAFAGEYGLLNQWLSFVDWIHFDKPQIIIINLISGIALIAALSVLIKYKKNIAATLLCACCIGFAADCVINLSKINKEYAEFEKLSKNMQFKEEIEPEFHLTKTGKNVVIIFLDRAMSTYFEPILEEKPELRKQYEGFVYYPNCLSFNMRTMFGAPPLFGGYEYIPSAKKDFINNSFKKVTNESLLVLPRVFTEQADFNCTIADAPWANWSWNPDMSIADDYSLIDGKNVELAYRYQYEKNHPELNSNEENHEKCLKRNFFSVSLFRISPMILRPFVNKENTWWDSDDYSKTSGVPSSYPELAFLDKLTDFTSDKDSFVYFANQLTHDGATLDAPDYYPVKEKTQYSSSPYAHDRDYDVNICALLRVGEWLEFLKRENCYDNTRIIIVSDHGNGSLENSVITKDFNTSVILNSDGVMIPKDFFHPLLLVKDFNSNNDLSVDDAFMTNADVPTIACKDIIEHPVNPFSGKEITDEYKKNGVEIFTRSIETPDFVPDLKQKPINDKDWYFVKENIFDDENWYQFKSKD